MFVPKDFSINELEIAINFIRENNFGLLTCNGDDFPQITHLPFILKQKEEHIFLYTHLASANKHCMALEKNKSVLIVFNGHHAYISPSWYSSKFNVPTWNYCTVHVAGEANLITDNTDKKNLLLNTLEQIEPEFIDAFQLMPEKHINTMVNELTGIEIKITNVECNFKLSQNKSKADILAVMSALNQSGDQNKKELAKQMKRFNSKKLSL